MSQKQILLIEPDVVLGGTYSKALSVCGAVGWAKSAEGAVQQADAKTPDLVILEPKLSRHNGVEFLYEFKSYPEWREVPIIIFSSGESLTSSEDTLNSLGIVAQLDKHSTSLQKLCSVVQDVLGDPSL